MLQSLVLRRFKGFANFRVIFGKRAVLVGPNNAGKSTIVSAIRLASAAARLASRRKAADSYQDGGRWVRGYPLRMVTSEGFIEENVRHEFRNVESRLELKYSSGATLKIVWPVDGGEGFFWIHDPNGPTTVTPAKAKELLTPIGIVPTITPVEYDESRRDPAYIRQRVETRLASRHFRNHLSELKSSSPQDYDRLIKFLLENTPELTTIEVRNDYRDGDAWIDLFYNDVGSRTDKELYWAGDGLQIWLQLLYHLWRNRQSEVVVLDEPDVFLHPDLQRRLVHIIEQNPQQAILASHAPELVNEAEQGSVVWIDRSVGASRNITNDALMAEMSGLLGTGFNLGVARALRAKVALFVEGQDMKLVRSIARNLGLNALAKEEKLAVVGIGGFSRWPGIEVFSWIKEQLLGDAVKIAVLLDRDYRHLDEIESMESRLGRLNIKTHVWRRKEIENYLLEPALIAAVAQVSEEAATELLMDVIDSLKSKIVGQFTSSAMHAAASGTDPGTIATEVHAWFDKEWREPSHRIAMSPGKTVISLLNQRLQQDGHPTVSAQKLAEVVARDLVSTELFNALSAVEDLLV